MGHFNTRPPIGRGERFERAPSRFRNWIRNDHASAFRPEAGRYHLYVSLACPWSHRTMIARQLLRLEDVVPATVLEPVMDERGWRFSERVGCGRDPLFGAAYLREIYERAEADYRGRWTVPVLWDSKSGTIVNNESREIMRMMTTELSRLSGSHVDLFPTALRARIDETIDWLYDAVNDAVYRVGFARSQAAYDEAVEALFRGLHAAEHRLAEHRFLCADTLTEADICLFVTLLRFEPVYAILFKCTTRPLCDYPNLSAFLRDVFQIPGVASTCDIVHIKEHYYRSHPELNPRRIVPDGPVQRLDPAHYRELMGHPDGAPLLERPGR